MTHFKLGLLALASVAALIAAAFGLGIHLERVPTVEYHTYVDESVQGLDVGAAVKYRGVQIGNVSAIVLAPDNRLVDVSLAIRTHEASQLGLASPPPALRAQVTSVGITGVKFVDLDFVEASASPPPALSFAPAEHYIPARPSLFATLSNSSDRITRLVDNADRTLQDIESVTHDLRDANLPARVSAAIDDIRRVARHTDASLTRADRVLDSGGKAIDTLAALGRRTLPSTAELARTLRDIGDAARSFRDLVDAVEREPDILVKGRARPKGL